MPRRSPSLRLAPRHKVWLLADGLFLMGPNYLRFLRAVDETGTIREGAKAVGWSYRTCLNRVRRMERALGGPVLLTARGGHTHGGSRLSPDARRLMEGFERWHQAVSEFSRKAFARHLGR
ncbi:MAG: LysR family transcriptional regulator [Gemmatimonadales bacterium]|nr:LysR family transcriptional regulator [Gemmatimonadales bacterium]